jgi:hypothetical protein
MLETGRQIYLHRLLEVFRDFRHVAMVYVKRERMKSCVPAVQLMQRGSPLAIALHVRWYVRRIVKMTEILLSV